jgi:hypothetical protein
MFTLAIGRHMIARSPTTDGDTVGFIVIQPVARAAAVSVSAYRYDAAGRQDRDEPDNEGGRHPA